MWDKYAAVFPAVWIASAFKGATGSDKYITDISKYELLIQLARGFQVITLCHLDYLTDRQTDVDVDTLLNPHTYACTHTYPQQ